ncbi:hypothetical protein DIPPA_31998 [Diplonema papillatum]|nr:hypothetical protein DIPPA_31998 [Diplonema papillatum]
MASHLIGDIAIAYFVMWVLLPVAALSFFVALWLDHREGSRVSPGVEVHGLDLSAWARHAWVLPIARRPGHAMTKARAVASLVIVPYCGVLAGSVFWSNESGADDTWDSDTTVMCIIASGAAGFAAFVFTLACGWLFWKYPPNRIPNPETPSSSQIASARRPSVVTIGPNATPPARPLSAPSPRKAQKAAPSLAAFVTVAAVYIFIFVLIVAATIVSVFNTSDWDESWQEARLVFAAAVACAWHLVLETLATCIRRCTGPSPAPAQMNDEDLEDAELKEADDTDEDIKEAGSARKDSGRDDEVVIVKNDGEKLGLKMDGLKMLCVIEGAAQRTRARDFEGARITHLNGEPIATNPILKEKLKAAPVKDGKQTLVLRFDKAVPLEKAIAASPPGSRKSSTAGAPQLSQVVVQAETPVKSMAELVSSPDVPSPNKSKEPSERPGRPTAVPYSSAAIPHPNEQSNPLISATHNIPSPLHSLSPPRRAVDPMAPLSVAFRRGRAQQQDAQPAFNPLKVIAKGAVSPADGTVGTIVSFGGPEPGMSNMITVRFEPHGKEKTMWPRFLQLPERPFGSCTNPADCDVMTTSAAPYAVGAARLGRLTAFDGNYVVVDFASVGPYRLLPSHLTTHLPSQYERAYDSVASWRPTSTPQPSFDLPITPMGPLPGVDGTGSPLPSRKSYHAMDSLVDNLFINQPMSPSPIRSRQVVINLPVADETFPSWPSALEARRRSVPSAGKKASGMPPLPDSSGIAQPNDMGGIAAEFRRASLGRGAGRDLASVSPMAAGYPTLPDRRGSPAGTPRGRGHETPLHPAAGGGDASAEAEVFPESAKQFRQMISQFYARYNPIGLRAVDEIVVKGWDQPDGARELLARLYMNYPKQVIHGELRWLELLVKKRADTSLARQYYAINAPRIPRTAVFDLVADEAVEEMPVWSSKKMSLRSSNGHWVVCDDNGTVLIHSSGVHLGGMPSEVWLWSDQTGAEPAITVQPDSIALRLAKEGEAVPLRAAPPPAVVTYELPEEIPEDFFPGRNVIITREGEPDSDERKVAYRVDGTNKKFETKRRIAMSKDEHGFFFYIPNLGSRSIVYLPSDTEAVIGRIKALADAAGVQCDFLAEYKSLMKPVAQKPSSVAGQAAGPAYMTDSTRLLHEIDDEVFSKTNSIVMPAQPAAAAAPPLPLKEDQPAAAGGSVDRGGSDRSMSGGPAPQRRSPPPPVSKVNTPLSAPRSPAAHPSVPLGAGPSQASTGVGAAAASDTSAPHSMAGHQDPSFAPPVQPFHATQPVEHAEHASSHQQFAGSERTQHSLAPTASEANANRLSSSVRSKGKRKPRAPSQVRKAKPPNAPPPPPPGPPAHANDSGSTLPTHAARPNDGMMG